MNRDESSRNTAAARLLWSTARVVLRTLLRVYFSGRIHHADRVPQTGPVILASNHVSFADPPLVACCLDRTIGFLARDSLFKPPWFAALIRTLHAIPIDRDGGGPSGIKMVLGRLQNGEGILLFPEGTRSLDGEIQPARMGIGLLALRSGAPVVPVRIFGLHKAWGRGQRFPRPHPSAIKFGTPMHFTELRAEAANADKARVREIYDEISRQIMAAIERLQPCDDVTHFP